MASPLAPPSGAQLLGELSVSLGADGFRPSDPLLLVQVTDFACSGFIAGKLLFSLPCSKFAPSNSGSWEPDSRKSHVKNIPIYFLMLYTIQSDAGQNIIKESQLIAPQNERSDQEMITASKEEYEQLPPYMKSLASWEVLTLEYNACIMSSLCNRRPLVLLFFLLSYVYF
ncbi:hypothetical protein PVAP13_7NG317600 [Panicum virgatum]|uniref:Uncharacterized protein n=1 Tax=Panicum virgatum TaxID=38727 RepID=A0A8T0Q0P7_PANVG|nr:hypothetical protein PVAP13_7NG317600 [Panicum virgatum]